MTKIKPTSWFLSAQYKFDNLPTYAVSIEYITMLSKKATETESSQRFDTLEEALEFVRENVEL